MCSRRGVLRRTTKTDMPTVLEIIKKTTDFFAGKGTAIDSSGKQLALANENAVATGMADRVTLLRSSWYERLDASERFELIVANPPYLSAAEVVEATPEVRLHEPASALTPASE